MSESVASSAFSYEPQALTRTGSNLSVSGMSVTSTATSATTDARLLSKATRTATIAAKSILSSGGDSDTALKTAKAAAQGVLLSALGTSLGNGPKAMLKKRKIKKQADVVASMALVSATDTLASNGRPWGHGEPDDASQSHNNFQSFDFNSDVHSTVSSFTRPTVISTPRSKGMLPPKTPSSRSLPPMPRPFTPPPIKLPIPFADASKPELEEVSDKSTSEASAKEEKQNLLEHETVARAVAIRIESNRNEGLSPVLDVGSMRPALSDLVECSTSERMTQYTGGMSTGSLETFEDETDGEEHNRSRVLEKSPRVDTTMENNSLDLLFSISSFFQCFTADASPDTPKATERTSSQFGSQCESQESRSHDERDKGWGGSQAIHPHSSIEPALSGNSSSSSVSSVHSDELLGGLDDESDSTLTETEDEQRYGKSSRRHLKEKVKRIVKQSSRRPRYDSRNDSEEDSSYDSSSSQEEDPLFRGRDASIMAQSKSGRSSQRSRERGRGRGRERGKQRYY